MVVIRFLSFKLFVKGPGEYPAASHQSLLPPRCNRVSGSGEGEPELPEAHLWGQGLPAAKGPSWRALLLESEATQVHRWACLDLHVHINYDLASCISVNRTTIFRRDIEYMSRMPLYTMRNVNVPASLHVGQLIWCNSITLLNFSFYS